MNRDVILQKPAAVVIGSGVTALGVLRSLSEHKIPVYLDCREDDRVRNSRYYRHFSFLSNNFEEIDFERLAALPHDKIVLIPCSDLFIPQVLNIPPQYKERMCYSNCSLNSLETLIDKENFARQIELTGINAPKTYLLNSRDDLTALPETAFQNMFLKPTDSFHFLHKFGTKALRVDSRQDALEKFDSIAEHNCDLVLQTYVSGPSSNHYFVDGFCDRNGEFKALFARRRFRIFPRDFGNSCFMRSVPLSEVASAVEDLKTLLSSINYRGIFSAEFKLDETDKVLKIIEVNARAWWYVGFATACGVNTPLMAYQDALGLDVPTVSHYPIDVKCAYPYLDLNAYRDELISGPGLFEMLGDWIGAKQPIFRWSDPMPAIAMVYDLAKRFVRKKAAAI